MFDLEKKEKFIIIFLVIACLIILAFKLHQKSSQIADVKIRAFDYEGIQAEPEKININEVGADELASLDGIGPALANRIVEYRNQNGLFRSTDELKKVKGIGDKLFDRIKNSVSIE